MDLGFLVGIMIIAFIFIAWLVFAENVKVPEKFAVRLNNDTLTGLDIYDSSGGLLYSVLYDESGTVQNVIVEDCTCFVIYWESEKIKGIGQFRTKSGTVYPKIYGKSTDNAQHCHNSEEIRATLTK